jgi:hypothetical protein
VNITLRLLRSVGHWPRVGRIPSWPQPAIKLDTAALQQDWHFDCGWSATAAAADTARGLVGRRLGAQGSAPLSRRLPVPPESVSCSWPSDGTALQCAAPDGLEGEFDDRIDPRFPVFSAASFVEPLPGPLTPMTIDVQVTGLRFAGRVMGEAMAFRGTLAGEWGSRAVAVFGHRVYFGVSSGALAANQLPGCDERDLTERSLDGNPHELFPLGRPPSSMPGSTAGAVVLARALTMLRHVKADTRTYSAAALTAHLDAAQLAALTDARLEVRAQLLRDRIHQGWSLAALWVIDSGVTATTLKYTVEHGLSTESGFAAVTESGGVTAEIAPLADSLRRDPRLRELAATGDLAGIRAVSPRLAGKVDAATTQMPHRGPGEMELANPVFGDDQATLLATAAAAGSAASAGAPRVDSTTVGSRMAASARTSRELTYDATARFTHALRMTLREMGSRCVSAELIDVVDDVYYLTLDELLVMPADARLRIKRRRAERERLQTMGLPNIVDHSWTPLDGYGQPDRRTQLTSSPSGTC